MFRSVQDPTDPPAICAALVGVGEFGSSFLFRSGRAEGLRVAAAADPDTNKIVEAAMTAGWPRDKVSVCGTTAQVSQAFDRTDLVAVTDARLLTHLPLDFIVEATGAPESAAKVALTAIANKINVAMVSKECDSVVGPILQERARQAGVFSTIVDGDQPSLAVGLIQWARHLGLEVVCAGKASEYDFVADLSGEQVTANNRQESTPGLAGLWASTDANATDQVAARARLMSSWPHATTPDLCELGLIANATDLNPASPSLHAPIARTVELPHLFRPRSDGGLLDHSGSLDIFNCLRRPDELSFAGGVFVIVKCDDPATWAVLRGKGIPVSADGRYGLLHNPVHLLGLEAPATLFKTIQDRQPAAQFTPRYDLVAQTTEPLRAGTRLTMGPRHSIHGLKALLLPAQPARASAPIPYYMAADQILASDVPAGAMLETAQLCPPAESTLWSLRADQDQLFFPA